jgi:hypothetical protein
MPPPRPREHDSATATRLTRAGTADMLAEYQLHVVRQDHSELADLR